MQFTSVLILVLLLSTSLMVSCRPQGEREEKQHSIGSLAKFIKFKTGDGENLKVNMAFSMPFLSMPLKRKANEGLGLNVNLRGMVLAAGLGAAASLLNLRGRVSLAKLMPRAPTIVLSVLMQLATSLIVVLLSTPLVVYTRPQGGREGKRYGVPRFIKFNTGTGDRMRINLEFSMPFLSLPLNKNHSSSPLVEVNLKGIALAAGLGAVASLLSLSPAPIEEYQYPTFN